MRTNFGFGGVDRDGFWIQRHAWRRYHIPIFLEKFSGAWFCHTSLIIVFEKLIWRFTFFFYDMNYFFIMKYVLWDYKRT